MKIDIINRNFNGTLEARVGLSDCFCIKLTEAEAKTFNELAEKIAKRFASEILGKEQNENQMELPLNSPRVESSFTEKQYFVPPIESIQKIYKIDSVPLVPVVEKKTRTPKAKKEDLSGSVANVTDTAISSIPAVENEQNKVDGLLLTPIESPQPTLDDLRAAIQECMTRDGKEAEKVQKRTDAIKKMFLESYKAINASDFPKDKIGEAITKLKQM